MPATDIDSDERMNTSKGSPGHLFWALAILYLGSCAVGLVHFQIWGQIRDMMRNTVPSEWVESAFSDPTVISHGHLPRSLCVLPSMLLAEALGVEDDDDVFSIFAGFCIVLTALCVNRAHAAFFRPSGALLDVAVLAGFAAVSLFMNGRMCLGLCGYSIIVWTHLSWLVGKHRFFVTFAYSCTGLLLLTVSSGAFFIGTGLLVIWCAYWARGLQPGGKPRPTVIEIVCILLLLALACYLTNVFFEKMLDFYEVDDIEKSWRILEHGLARYMWDDQLESVAIFAMIFMASMAALAALLWIRTMARHALATYFVAIIAFGLVCGLFGDSTMATSLPAVAILLKKCVLTLGCSTDDGNLVFDDSRSRRAA
jgi:hypothetical protein